MNCHQSQQMLSRMLDHELSSADVSLLAAHLQTCPACRDFKLTLQGLSRELRAEADAIAVPDADQAWQLLQSQQRAAAQWAPARPRRLAPVFWLGAPLAAAAALAFIFITPNHERSGDESFAGESLAAVTTQVDYVESGDPAAATMVYVDKQSGWLVVWASDPTSEGKG